MAREPSSIDGGLRPAAPEGAESNGQIGRCIVDRIVSFAKPAHGLGLEHAPPTAR